MARKSIQLSLIDDNPYRDFELDPINEEQVEDLKASIKDLGFWEGVRARKRGDRFQLVFGHHRIRALRELKWKEAYIDVVDYDDYQMVKAMGLENINQRKGTSDYQDAVAGAIRVIGYKLLQPDAKSLKNDHVGKILPTSKAVETSRGLLLKGKGLGHKVITDFFDGAISVGNVKSAIQVIKKTGKMQEYLEEIQDRIIEKSRELKAKEEKARRQADKDRLTKEAAKLAEAKDDLELVVEEVSKQEVKLHPGIGKLFPVTHVYDSVASVLSSKRALELIPVEHQVETCVEMIKFFVLAGNRKDALTGKEAKKLLNNYISNSLQWIKEETSKEVTDREERRKQWEKLVKSVGAAVDAANTIKGYVEDGRLDMFTESEFHEYSSSMMTLISITDVLDDLVSSDSVVSDQ